MKKTYPKKGDLVKIEFVGIPTPKINKIRIHNKTGLIIKTVKAIHFEDFAYDKKHFKPKTYVVLVDGETLFVKEKYLRILNV